MSTFNLEPYKLTEEVKEIKRDAIRLLWVHTVTITCKKNVYNPSTGVEEPTDVVICKDEPCRLSKQTTNPNDGAPKQMEEMVHCMFRPEIDVPPGSTLIVNFNGKTETYDVSGPAQVYWDHQTVKLLIKKPNAGGKYA